MYAYIYMYIYIYTYVNVCMYVYVYADLIPTDLVLPTRAAPDAPRWAELTESGLGPEMSATTWDMLG